MTLYQNNTGGYMSLEQIKDRPLQVAVLTVSDTRTLETDKGGNKVVEFLSDAHHVIADRKIVKDDFEEIQTAVKMWADLPNIDVIITTGGTGIAMRDVTIEAVSPLFDKEINGFGEIFRYLSYTKDIGTKALASRAVAGVSNETLIFSVPGSVGAVTLAMKELIIPEFTHLVYEIKK